MIIINNILRCCKKNHSIAQSFLLSLHHMMDQFLHHYFPWYGSYDAGGRQRFQERVQQLLKGRQIKGKQGQEVESAHKVLIMAAAAHATFHVRKFYLPHFNLVTVYPDQYFTLIRKRYRQDIIHLPGALVISWGNLEKEFTDDTLPFQTVFHELGHALYYENKVEKEGYLTIEDTILQQFMHDYAAFFTGRLPSAGSWLQNWLTNQPQQFFAAACEAFWAVPKALQHEAPLLYDWLFQVLHGNTEKNRE